MTTSMSHLRSIHYTNLERKGKYIVKTENGIYKGQYFTQPQYYFPYIVLTFVTCKKNGTLYSLSEAIFDKQDTFYNAEEYITQIKKKAFEAREQMELRALNKILKGVVNDEFQWL
jgi:hypothetical protein